MAKPYPLLLVPEKTDPDTTKVMEAWTKNGGTVKRLGKYWIRDEHIAAQQKVFYGNQTFSLVLEQIYNVRLISPDDTLIAKLDRKWTGRNILLQRLQEIPSNGFPVFIKPVVPKLFQAGVFHTAEAFEKAVSGLRGNEEVLVSEIVHISAEARSFVLNGHVLDIALYEGKTGLPEGKKFLEDFILHNKEKLPAALVIDLAYGMKTGWFILEFNAAWGAGLNSCDAEKVVECIRCATT